MEQKSLIGKEILKTYRIEALIGSGGMGSVYLAANKHINEKVAIKVLNANLAESGFVRRKFVQEAKTLLNLHHANIVAYQNFCEDEDGNIFLVMEYVDGITLSDFISHKQGLIPEKMAYPMFLQILDACACAHRQGIIHRDVKPSNIILTGDSEGNFVVKILDFGIAKIISESEDENDSENGMTIGTPACMSPEQVRGESLDRRSDIYSLGVLLHQMLTGRAPYDTTTLSEIEIQQKVVSEPLPRMKEFYSAVSDKMQRIVDKATQKEPASRYQSCGDFRAALKNAVEPDRTPRIIKYAAAALILLLLGGGYWYYDYNYVVKTYYYKDYAEQWGVPAGIGKADYSRREKTYKFEYRQGKLRRLQLVNSKGKVVEDSESERFDRPINADFEYSSGKHIAYILYKDKNGKPFFRKRYNIKDGKINMFVFEYNDDNGTDKRLPKDMTGYTRLEYENAERGQISRFALEFDKNGYVTALHYRNQAGEPAGDSERIFGKRYERDSKGRVQKEYFLTVSDSVTATSWGLGVKEFTYDSKDNLVKVTYLSPGGLPSLDDKDGIAVYEMIYDDDGNLAYGWHKSPEDSLTLPKKSGVAGINYTYNKNGENTETYYMGIDRKPMYRPVTDKNPTGFIGIRREYDEYGFVKKQTYIDENGEPAVASSGETYCEIINDKNGNLLEYKIYDMEYKPFENIDGYCKTVSEYDSLGNQVSGFFYGADDSLFLNAHGYAGQRYKWNDKNKLTEYAYYGVDSHPCEVNDVYTVKYEYDSRGNEIKKAFYAADGQTLTINSVDGIAGYLSKYDENNNEIEVSYFDAGNKPAAGKLGYAGYRKTYNSYGYMEEISYFDINGKLVFNRFQGYARVKYINDTRGNHIEISKYDSNNRLIGTTERRVFNTHDDIIEQTYFDANGNKALYGGYHKMVSAYNERRQLVEAKIYDINGQLKSDVAIGKVKYDNRGNITEYAYFNADEKLVINNNYAFFRKEYDAMNRVVRETYFDENSKPTKPSVQFPEILYGYDKRGNKNYEAYADGNGNLINQENGYSILRTEYNIKGYKLEESYYDKTDNPTLDVNSAFKITCAYDKKNNVTEKRYYGFDGLRKTNFAIEKYKYSDLNQETERAYYNCSENKVDCDEGWHKRTFSYDETGYVQYIRFYSANNQLLQTKKRNASTGDYEVVGNNYPSSESDWRGYWQRSAKGCPINVDYGIICTSILLTSNGCTLQMQFTGVAKYQQTGEELENCKDFARKFAAGHKKESQMPSSATLTIIGVDKDKSELFRINH